MKGKIYCETPKDMKRLRGEKKALDLKLGCDPMSRVCW